MNACKRFSTAEDYIVCTRFLESDNSLCLVGARTPIALKRAVLQFVGW